jgi:hypothetical protein
MAYLVQRRFYRCVGLPLNDDKEIGAIGMHFASAILSQRRIAFRTKSVLEGDEHKSLDKNRERLLPIGKGMCIRFGARHRGKSINPVFINV